MTARKEPEKAPNIHQRILAIMAEVDYVKKTDKKVNNQYTFVSHDDVTAKLHPMLVKHGIVAIPSVRDTGQNGNRTEVTLETDFVNAESPGDKITIRSVGYGIDPQDKGPGKAVSYAYKYALLKLFALETGDDPERDMIEHEPADPPAVEPPPKREWAGPLNKTTLKQHVRAIGTDAARCTDTEELKGLINDNIDAINQCKVDLPEWAYGDGEDKLGLIGTLDAKMAELTGQERAVA